MRKLDTCALFLLSALTGCTFNFDVTSQRTALENQVMGSYKELDDDLILVSSVRGSRKPAATAQLSPEKRRALDARENQEFNRDDIDELKDRQILGEAASGELALVPDHPGRTGDAVAAKVMQLAKALVDEENRDRAVIWRRIIDANANLSANDLPDVRRTYAKLQRDQARPGQWLQDEAGVWRQKPGSAGGDALQ